MEILEEDINGMLTSEWTTIMSKLMYPFAVNTDILLSGYKALSSIFPAIMDLESRLERINIGRFKQQKTTMLKELKPRFSTLLDAESQDSFNPVPLAATLLTQLYHRHFFYLEKKVYY